MIWLLRRTADVLWHVGEALHEAEARLVTLSNRLAGRRYL